MLVQRAYAICMLSTTKGRTDAFNNHGSRKLQTSKDEHQQLNLFVKQAKNVLS